MNRKNGVDKKVDAFIPYARVVCDGNELNYVREVIESGWLTTASKCSEFEKKFAALTGVEHACAVNSATAALHLACEAIGIGPGDRVFVPTMTFTASAEVIRYLGADPVFLDVEYGTCLITPEILETAIARHPGTKALILVHFGGQPAELGPILDLCRANDIRLIEDAAHAFPSRYNGRPIGSFGEATCFSFYANKTITTGEGGMLTTNDVRIYKRAKTMRLHGIDRDIWDRFTRHAASWEYDVVAPGYKYNLSDIAAAVGLAQLERAEAFRLKRQTCAEFYFAELRDVTCLELPRTRCSMEDHSWHLFPVVVTPGAPVPRDAFIQQMTEHGIGTSVHYKPLHRMSYYQHRYHLDPANFPNAEKWWNGCVSLPIYPSLTKDELQYICRIIHSIFSVRSD